jgi:hypothetical protein
MSWDSKAPNTFLKGKKGSTYWNPKRPHGQSKKIPFTGRREEQKEVDFFEARMAYGWLIFISPVQPMSLKLTFWLAM